MFYEVVLPLLGMGTGVWVLYNGFRIANRALNQKHEKDLALAGGAAPASWRSCGIGSSVWRRWGTACRNWKNAWILLNAC